MDYRVEEKYIIYEDQIAYLNMKLKEIMSPDEHSRDGGYLIRSVYFDDYHDSALYENLSGNDQRAKFRIRTYDNDPSFIRLEEKSKRAGFTKKRSAVYDEETVRKLISGCRRATDAPVASAALLGKDDPLSRLLYTGMNTKLLHPVTIVEYERTAFVEKSGNVRITFDRNIGATDNTADFFENNIGAHPVLPTGAHILEVKYDELIPDHIRRLIDTGSLSRTAFSKYCYARQIRQEIGEDL